MNGFKMLHIIIYEFCSAIQKTSLFCQNKIYSYSKKKKSIRLLVISNCEGKVAHAWQKKDKQGRVKTFVSMFHSEN